MRPSHIVGVSALLASAANAATTARNITIRPPAELASNAPGISAGKFFSSGVQEKPNTDAVSEQSLLQCLYSQCDAIDYGQALASTIHLCVKTGAIIHMAAPNHYSGELLRSREEAYLEGREILAVPGLKLRQESVDPGAQHTATVTLTVLSPAEASFLTVTQTATATTTIALAPTLATPFTPSLRMLNNTDSNTDPDSAYLPWLVTAAGPRNQQPSYVSFMI
ncbi:uncharacterized protein B0I36DRAFT_427832 [Microdochium trichocladiopsis]|uniref:Uncharacterized protein n=1 Tax=Microdochium trichocladiopsis TaxID=1682393 RepID=A0A9P8YAL1_9PEZI|nr:uncharacterized protein B0I36DRAFT_427832 [Microdochium trichocladiopsis]KAH7037111.1 hypothetical protein B0I36DRAFT_427832 [Microdochium trichocladiopsis]